MAPVIVPNANKLFEMCLTLVNRGDMTRDEASNLMLSAGDEIFEALDGTAAEAEGHDISGGYRYLASMLLASKPGN